MSALTCAQGHESGRGSATAALEGQGMHTQGSRHTYVACLKSPGSVDVEVRHRRPDGESLTAYHRTRQTPDLATGDRSEFERLGEPIQGLAGLGSPGPDRAGLRRRSQ